MSFASRKHKSWTNIKTKRSCVSQKTHKSKCNEVVQAKKHKSHSKNKNAKESSKQKIPCKSWACLRRGKGESLPHHGASLPS